MEDNQNAIFGSFVNKSDDNAVSDNSKLDNTASPANGFTKFKPEEQMPNFENSTFYQARQSGAENPVGSDRKRGRRALHDENSLDDILGQCKSHKQLVSTLAPNIFVFLCCQ